MEIQDREVKQVIVIRKDLGMRRGKEIAQGAHAAMAFLTRRLIHPGISGNSDFPPRICGGMPRFTPAEEQWIISGFKKVVVRVNSAKELEDIYIRACEASLVVNKITDSGRTEFHGVPTVTCLAIGPDYSDRIDPVTGELELY